MPTKKTPVILEMGVELDNFKKELQTALSSIRKVKSEFGDISSEEANLVKMMEMVNKAMAIYSTKADSTGKVSLKDAKELVDIYTKLQTTILNVSDAETSRLSPKLLKQRIEDLTKESSVLQTNIKLLEEQEKKRSELKSSNINVVSVMNEEDKKKLSGYVTSETGGILTKTEFRERSKNLDISEEDNKKIIDYYQKARNLASETREEINRLNLEIESTNKIIEVENAKIQALKSQGVSSGLDSSSFQNSVQGTTEALIQNTKEAERNNRGFVDLNKTQEKNTNTFAKAAKTFISFNAVLRVLRAVGNEAIRTIKDMDEALTGMTMVTGKSRKEVLEYVDTFKDLAQQTSATMTEIANLTTEYLRQGRSIEDSLVLAEETAKAAKIAGISVTDSIQYMTSTLNGFNMAASEASYVSDVFAKVAVSTATDYEQLAVALSKVSAQANLAGMSMEFTTSLLAKGIEVTQEAPESIGTALKTVVARMRELSDYNKVLEDGTSVNKVEKALSAAGIALRNQNGEFRDLEVIFNELGPKWEKLNSNQQQAIAQAVAGTRQQSRFVAIMQDWNRTLEITADAANSAGEATYEYNQYAKGLTATMDRLTTSWQGFTTSLVNTEFIIGILDKVTGLLNIMSEMSGFFKVILVSITGIVAQQKLSNLLQEHRKNKLAQSMALENQLTKEQKLQLEAEKQSLFYARQKVQALEDELALTKQKRLNERSDIKNKLDAAIKDGSLKLKKDGSYNMRTSKKNKDLVERYNLLEKENTLETNIGLKLNEQNKILESINGRERVGLLNKAKEIGYLILSAFTTDKKLTAKKAEVLLSNKDNLLAQIRLILLKEEVIKEMAITEEKKEQLRYAKMNAKTNISSSLKIAGNAAIIAAAVIAIGLAWKEVSDNIHSVERAQEKVVENNDKIYETSNNISGLENLITEYEELTRKISLTNEELERMEEIRKSMAEEHGIEDVEAARAKIIEYSREIEKLEKDNLVQLNKAYVKAGKSVFKQSQFINTFNKFINSSIEKTIEENLKNVEDRNTAKNISQNVTSYMDREGYMNQKLEKAEDEYRKGIGKEEKNIGAGALGVGIGAAGIGAGALGIGMATSSIAASSALFSVGALLGPVGWIALGIIGVAGGIAIVARAVSEKNKDVAEGLQKIQEKEQTFEETVGKFASEMSEKQDSFYKMAEVYNKYTDDSNEALNDLAIDAIKDSYSFIEVFRKEGNNFEDIAFLDKFKDNLGFTQSEMSSLISSYYEYGEELGNAFVIGMAVAARDNKSEEFIKELLKNNKIDGKSFQEYFDENYNKQYEEYYNLINKKDLSGEDRKSIEKILKKDFLMDKEEVEEMSEEELLKTLTTLVETKKTTDYETALKNSRNIYLSGFSAYDSSLGVSQALTSMQSEQKTYEDYIKKIKEGSFSQNDLINIIGNITDSNIRDKLYSAMEKGNTLDMINILTEYKNSLEKTDNVMDDYIKRLEKEKEITEDPNRLKSIEEELEMMKSIRNTQEAINKTKLQQLIIDNKISKAQKDLEEGGVSAERVNNLLENELSKAKNTANTILKNLGSKYDWEMIRSIVNGEQVVNKDQYSKILEYYNSIESHLKEIDEIQQEIAKNNETALENQLNVQNELLDAYKSQLEQEQEALQESLDKRKEMYEKYFDTLDEESSDESFEDQQARLQNAIARLSTANDATSLSKLKEYQEQLAELEKEQLQSERDRRREATMTNLDNESEAIEQYYDSRLENEQVLWEEITKLNKDGLSSLLKDYNVEYQKATDLMKEKLEKDMNELTDFALRMINPELYKVPTTITVGEKKVVLPDTNNQNIDNSTINNKYEFTINTDDPIAIRDMIEGTMKENGILGIR